METADIQTRNMAHIYMSFDFGPDEEKAQQARHKLDGWKQAFRLDKKLLYKFDRENGDGNAADDGEEEKAEKPSKTKKGKTAKAVKAKEKEEATPSERIKLLIRLGFSNHEKLTEQRWVDRIPAEEPFKDAEPEMVKENQDGFAEIDQKFESLD